MRKEEEHILAGLILGNFLLTLLLFWILYSEIRYIKSGAQYFGGETISQTAIIANPITGSFVFVNSFILGILIIALILAFIGLYFFRKKLIS